jgi:putative hydroxymethylpyrimidine transport system permease protein
LPVKQQIGSYQQTSVKTQNIGGLLALPTLTFVGFMLVWQLVAMVIHMNNVVPSPISVVKKLFVLRAVLFCVHLPATLVPVFLGIAISLTIGVLLAVLMDSKQTLADMLFPFLVLLQSIPTICIAPLFVIWFGYSVVSRLMVVVLSSFFTVTVCTYDGLRFTKREMMDLMQVYNASPLKIFWKLRVPSALPNFFSGIKMLIPWSVVAVAFAEWLGATKGLGYFSYRMMRQMDGTGVFAPIVLLTAVSLLGMLLVQWMDRKVVTWRGEL